MNKEKFNSVFFEIVFLIVAFMILIDVLIGYRAFLNGQYSYSDMLISEWLINYAGGFVRRGLIGQLLLSVYNLYPHPITNTIIWIYLMGLIVLISTLFYVFKKEKWSPFIIIFPICISISFLGTRRDYWALFLSFVCFMFFSRYNNKRSFFYLVAANSICIINILLHEASFFFMLPLLFVCTFNINCAYSLYRRIYLSLITWLPSIISFVLVCIFKGDLGSSELIWESWHSCFVNYPMTDSTPPVGSAVEWLTHDTTYAFNLHIHRFWNSSFIYDIPSWPFNLYSIISTYYLVLFLNTIKIGKMDTISNYKYTLSNILIVQFIFLVPMFGFLSCDFGRIIMYWTSSSLFAYHWFKGYLSDIPIISTISIKIIMFLDKLSWLSNKWVYFVILITLPIAGSQGSNILSCFFFIPYGWRLTFWDYFLEVLPIVN